MSKTQSSDLIQLVVSRKTGAEEFCDGDQPLGFNLLSFWQWSASDLASNALRGRVAEYFVAQALGVAAGVRSEWDAFDLQAPNGLRIEVKSAAFLQTWKQKRLSKIEFDIAPTRYWSASDNEMGNIPGRHSDLFVFALLDHQEKHTLNPMDITQWKFYVLRTSVLNCQMPTQKSIGLSGLAKLGATKCVFADLKSIIEDAKYSSAKGGRVS